MSINTTNSSVLLMKVQKNIRYVIVNNAKKCSISKPSNGFLDVRRLEQCDMVKIFNSGARGPQFNCWFLVEPQNLFPSLLTVIFYTNLLEGAVNDKDLAFPNRVTPDCLYTPPCNHGKNVLGHLSQFSSLLCHWRAKFEC